MSISEFHQRLGRSQAHPNDLRWMPRWLEQFEVKAKKSGDGKLDVTNESVLQFLQKRPKAVLIEKWGVNIKADYGYQNGVYNLIDAARFDDAERGLAEAGKRVLEGRALADTGAHRLVVVGDFGDQSENYVSNIREELSVAGAKLFTIDEVQNLAEEIRRAAHH